MEGAVEMHFLDGKEEEGAAGGGTCGKTLVGYHDVDDTEWLRRAGRVRGEEFLRGSGLRGSGAFILQQAWPYMILFIIDVNRDGIPGFTIRHL